MSSKDEAYTIRSPHLQELVKILTSDKGEGSMKKPVSSYYAEGEIQPEDVNLQVNGIGHITFPFKPDTVKELKQMASLAAFGKGEQTKLDQKVRDTYVIRKDKLNVSINKMENILEDAKTKLGLGMHCTLEAHLHNMLIYEKGQHFDFHQDTEKMDNMVATMVVVLPSAHIGGDLVLKHSNKTHIFSTENVSADSVKYIAFYSDCHHKVEKIKDGFRIVLTYNMVLTSSQLEDIGSCNRNLINILIKEHFETFKMYGVPKVVYLFDHYYTDNNFKFSSLKGSDRQVATALLAAAKELSLVVRLALADVLEVWHDEERYPPGLLYNLKARLESWRDENDKRLNYVTYRWSDYESSIFLTSDDINCEAREYEICWSKHNKYFRPHRFEEGYTGNEGASKEKWYKRGAIVLWEQSCDLKIRFELNYDAEFRKLIALTDSPNNVDMVKGIIEKIGNNLYNNRKPLNLFIKLAFYVNDPKVAFDICKRIFDLFQTKNSYLLCELKEAYGSIWCFNLLEDRFQFMNREIFVQQLIDLIAIFKEKEDSDIIKQIFKHQIIQAGKERDMKYRVENYGKLVKAAYDVRSFECLDEILKIVTSGRWSGYYLAKFYMEYCKDLKEINTDTLKKAVLISLPETINTYKQMNVNRIEWLNKINVTNCKCSICTKVESFCKNGGKIIKFNLTKERYEHVCEKFELQNKGLINISTSQKVASTVCSLVIEKSIDVVDEVEAKLTECETLLQNITIAQPTEEQPPA